MTQESSITGVLVAAFFTALAFGFWRKNVFAGIFMFSVLIFIMKCSAMLMKFAMGKYQFP